LDSVERWGRIFKRANYGLDEEQVTAFVNELIRERDMLIKQLEHLFSLIRLAERAAGGTDNMAAQSYQGILDQAKEQPHPMMVEEKKAEYRTMPPRGKEAPKPEAQNRLQELIGTTDQTQEGEAEPEWEVQILPPIDIMQALKVMTSLDSLADIGKTELIPDINKPTIAVFVRKPMNLIDALKKLPQVAEVKGDGADGKPRKVQIVLSEKAISEKGK